MKTLIIAEKPSVAGDLARVLGKVPKASKGDWYENDELVIDSAVGHLVELIKPEDVDAKFKKWRLADLPIIPEHFELRPIEDNRKKFEELRKLIRRKDVEMVVNACDAGREGELIFTYITELANNQKPVRRMWMSSMTPEAIRDAYQQMRDGEQMRPLQDAARSRSEADWLIGMNGTRAITLQFSSMANIASVGRVQTPTLAMVCDREREIRNFVPRSYWRVEGTFAITSGTYSGYYQKPGWKKGDDEHDRADRLWNEAEAQAIAESLRAANNAEVSEEKKRSKQSSPRLFDLTSLQREANGRFGFPAGMTLNVAQALYEKHKVLTYPRTDARALPEDYGQVVRRTLAELNEPWATHAEKILQNNWIQPGNKRIFNNKQVSDHFAIIPTGTKPKKLNEREQKIYDLVTRRFMAVFFPPAEYDVTTRLTLVGEHTFKTEGKVLVVPGWLDVHGKGNLGEDSLAPLGPEDGKPATATPSEVEVHADETRPPPRYSEATLLAAMEGAGKLVEDDELAEAMKERGLGTPATRASTIDHLLRSGYMHREGRELKPSAKAEGLMEYLNKLDVEVLRSPAMTGEWEYKLRQVEEGRLTREAFMNGIAEVTKETINRLAAPPPTEETDIPCPMDEGRRLQETPKGWVTDSTIDVRGRSIPLVQINKVVGNRRLDENEVRTLIEKKELGPLDGFKSRAGKPFSAVLKLVQKDNGTWRVDFDFGNDDENGNGQDDLDLSNYPVVGQSPVDNTPVHATPNAYMAEGKDKKGKPTLRIGRTMLGRTLTEEEVKELLEKRKSPLLKGLKSKRTGRFFDAFLLLKDDGGIQFEFPPRKKSAKKGGAKKAATKKAATKKATAAKSNNASEES